MTNKKSTKKEKSTHSSAVTQQDIRELRELVAKNLHHTQKLEGLAQKFDRYIFWVKIGTAVKVLLILAPIILAYIFVFPWLEEILDQYKSIVNILP